MTIGEQQRTCPYHYGPTYATTAELRQHQLVCAVRVRGGYTPDPLEYGWGLA